MITCPRCATPADERREAFPDAPDLVAIDVCRTCSGVWLDGAEVVTAFRKLADVARSPWPRAPRGDRAAIERCPRCAGSVATMPFFDMDLDRCAQCHGVWLDGDEVTALGRSLDAIEGRTVAAGGYRDGAAAAMEKKVTQCFCCMQKFPLDRTLVTAQGLVCDECHAKIGDGDGAADDDPELERMQRDLRSGSSFDGASVADVATFLFGVLGSFGRCSCGCYSSSCRH